MKKLMVLATAVLLSGCAGGNKNEITPMPIDDNPSIALKYARAMNLRLITDYDIGHYVIFNENTGKTIRPNANKIVKESIQEVERIATNVAQPAIPQEVKPVDGSAVSEVMRENGRENTVTTDGMGIPESSDANLSASSQQGNAGGDRGLTSAVPDKPARKRRVIE